MARAMNPNLRQRALIYTRRLTYVWSFIMFVMLIVFAISISWSKEAYELYHGLISYVIVGSVFGVEHFVRMIYMKKSRQIEVEEDKLLVQV